MFLHRENFLMWKDHYIRALSTLSRHPNDSLKVEEKDIGQASHVSSLLAIQFIEICFRLMYFRLR